MKKTDKFSVRARIGSFRYAINGLVSLLRSEHNSRIHLFATILAIMAGFLLKINVYEWILIIILIGIVFMAELINSAIENLADLIDPEWNESIMKAKDFSAASVLVSAVIAIVAGCLIFIPKLVSLF